MLTTSHPPIISSKSAYSTSLEKDRTDNARIEKITRSIIAENGFDRPPIYARGIALKCGIKVIPRRFPKEHQHIAGLIASDGKTIFVNDLYDIRQQNFTIAHELGHYVLGHNICDNSEDYHALNCDFNLQEQTPTEQEANRFAMFLLIPEDMLKKYMEEMPTASHISLSRIFGVPAKVMQMRLNESLKK